MLGLSPQQRRGLLAAEVACIALTAALLVGLLLYAPSTPYSSPVVERSTLDSPPVAPVFDPVDPTTETWSSAGAPTIAASAEQFYVVLRQRSDEQRGFQYEAYRADRAADLTERSNWEAVFREPMGDDAVSVEGSDLVRHDGRWWLYFCKNYGTGTGEWDVLVVSAETVDGLEAALDDPDAWSHVVDRPGSQKDPRVLRTDGTLYLYHETRSDEVVLKRLAAPTTVGETVHTFYSPGSDVNTGHIARADGRWVYWGKYESFGDGDAAWVFHESDDLRDWRLLYDHGPVATGPKQLRYHDSVRIDGTRVLVFEHGPRGSREKWTYVFDGRQRRGPWERAADRLSRSVSGNRSR